jgi:predicted amidohydrolase YtcJ
MSRIRTVERTWLLTMAATMLLASWLAPQTFAAEQADLVLRGGNVVTVDEQQPTAEAIAIRGDRILAVGSDKEIAKLIGKQTRVVELAGRLATPGWIEGHGHFLSLGASLEILDLRDAETWEAVVAQVAEAAKNTPEGTWIVGRGWHQDKWRRPPQPNVDGYPLHALLSRRTPKHPVLLYHASGHMAVANAKALAAAGVGRETKNPEGGELLRDDAGELTGVLRENAVGPVAAARAKSEGNRPPAERRAILERRIRLASDECLRHGITSFQDAGTSLQTLAVLREMAEHGDIPLRLWMMVRDTNQRLAVRLASVRVVGAAENHFTVRAIKRSIDGALGTHGAWLLQPYEDLPSSSGLNTASLRSLRQTADLALAHNYQLCIHAIGDRANREVLDLFQEELSKVDDGRQRRWRVEHAQHLAPEDIPRFAELGVIASMQAVHCTSDAPFVIQRLGVRRAREGAYVWRSLLDGGAVVINGTDAPVERVDPVASFAAGVTRRLADGTTFFPEQCMTREEALRSYTLSAAYAAFEDDLKGSLTPGKLADVVVFSRDLMSCPDDELAGVQVDLTIVGGNVVYQRKR